MKQGDEYMQFFSGATQDDSNGTRRAIAIARTKNLDAEWEIDKNPIFPLSEQVENTSLYFEEASSTWFLFTDHIGINKKKEEYTDAIWVYWTKDLNKWDTKHKAIVLDKNNCTWAKGAIGMPSVIKVGNRARHAL